MSQDGLSREDIVNILSISFVQLSKLLAETQYLILESSSGQLHYTTSKVRTVVRRRYLEDSVFVQELHQKIARHFVSICDPFKNKTWAGYYEFRSTDIIHHWLLSGVNLHEAVDTLCSLSFLESCFKSRSDHELIKFFTTAMKASATLEGQSHFKRLNEYSSFVQKHSSTLRCTACCIMSLASSYSSCGHMIYEDALALKSIWSEQSVIECLTPLGDSLNIVAMGKHLSHVIHLGVFQLKSVGKCCVTVSDDGTIKAWDLDSSLCVGEILEAPCPPGHIVKCAFSLTGVDRVLLADTNGSIFMYDLDTKDLLLCIEMCYKNGAMFFSDDTNGFWQQSSEGNLFFTPFEDSGDALRLEDSVASLNGSQVSAFGQKPEMNAVLARSNDGAKLAVLVSKYGGFVVLNSHKMSEICRFKDPLVSSTSLGQFSVSKDLLALTLDSGKTMIWKIDNHSRVSLIDTSEIKIQSLAFSSDETSLYVGNSDGDLFVIDIVTGVTTKKIALGTGKSRVLVCVATSYGKERFFFAAGQSVMMSNIKEMIANPTSAAGVELEESENSPVRQLFLADSDDYNAVSLLSTGVLCFWNKGVIVKRLSLPEGNRVESSGFHSASGIFVYISQGYLVVFSLREERELSRRAVDRLVKEIRIETLRQKGGDSLFVALLTISRELLGYLLTESSGTWSLKQLLERKKVTVVPKNPLQAGTDRLLIGSVDKTIVISIKTGKQVFERRSLSDEKIKDLMWFNPEDPQGMGDQIAFLTEDSLHAGEEVWSSGLPFAVPNVMENFEFCQEIGRLAYLGTQTIEVLDHTLGTLRPHSYSVLNVIQTLPTRKRLGSLDHDKAQIRKWCILPTRRHLLSLTVTGLLRVWDLETLALLGALKLPETFRTREMRVSFSGQDPLIYLTDGQKVLVFKLWLPNQAQDE
jgi:WD40 repeat protein